MKAIKNKPEGARGFTLIEMLVAIAVFTLASGAIAGSIVMLYRTQSYTMQQSQAIDEARKGVEIMSREIREARYGDNGAYPIEKGAGKEFIFYSDINGDGRVERVRYFLASVQSGSQTKECYSTASGGSCGMVFSGFLAGILKTAQIRVLTEGYYGRAERYAEFFADGAKLGNICASGCSKCAGAWQGTQTYDVAAAAADGSVQFTLDGTSYVSNQCNWVNPGHSLKARFEFSWTEEIPNADHELKKGVIEPVGSPAAYPADQEIITTISRYVRNAPPVFSYYDKNGSQITDDPAILRDTKMMKLFMVVNIDPARPPGDYELEQYVQIRNLKEE